MNRLAIKLLFFFNYISAIIFMCCINVSQPTPAVNSMVSLLLATIFLIDITYIVSCNLRENKILNLFGGLLAIDSWYLISLTKNVTETEWLFLLLSPIIILISIKFCFLFLFQSYKYKHKRATNFVLQGLCIAAILSVFFSNRIYAGMFGIQFIGSVLCFIFLIICHRRRVLSVLKDEWKIISFSVAFTLLAFLLYYIATINLDDHIGNFGMYLIVFIFSMSVHGIALKESTGVPLTSVFSTKQISLFILVSIILFFMFTSILQLPVTIFIIMINILFCLIFLVNIFLGENLKNKSSTMARNSKYVFALNQLRSEEKLKDEFAAFLHDEVLQDLLSVKNMTGKSNRPEVQKIIYDTLDNLNVHIRNRMQDYHPIILKSLTYRENLDNLIEGIAEIFPNKVIKTSFECSSNLFVAEPYDILIYRWIKELLINVYKHSDGKSAWIILSAERKLLKLTVCDNGTQTLSTNTLEMNKNIKHNGLSSIKEQVEKLGGTLTLSNNIPQGLRIEIEIMMDGGNSYQYFIG
ncbi:ATP-binding protein [Lachnospiraceae bacterium 66-29]